MNPLSYRKAAVESASPAGLVILMYDTLVGDIQRAIEAMHHCNIEERCRQINHAFQVLQQLELFLDMKNGGTTAKSLEQFYTHVRAKLLEAQFKQSPEILQKQIELVLDVREAWQSVDAATSTVVPAYAEEARVSSWSA